MKFMNAPVGAALLGIGLALSITAFAQSSQAGQASRGNYAVRTPQGASNADGEILVDPAKIYNKDPMAWVGKKVVLQNVTVQDTNDSGNFWVGSDNDHRLLVVKQSNNDNLKAMTVHKGDVVTIAGTVDAASRYMAQETTASGGSMHDAQKTTGVFLLANDINVASSTYK